MLQWRRTKPSHLRFAPFSSRAAQILLNLRNSVGSTGWNLEGWDQDSIGDVCDWGGVTCTIGGRVQKL